MAQRCAIHLQPTRPCNWEVLALQYARGHLLYILHKEPVLLRQLVKLILQCPADSKQQRSHNAPIAIQLPWEGPKCFLQQRLEGGPGNLAKGHGLIRRVFLAGSALLTVTELSFQYL